MANSGNSTLARPMDRKLGDEWTDWNGETGSGDLEADERGSTFVVLGGAVLLLLLVALNILWDLVKPRIEQLSPSAPGILQWCVGGFCVFVLLVVSVEGISVGRFKKSLLPYVWAEKPLLALFPWSVWLGRKCGLSRDRVANSFIKVHNLLLRAHADELNTERLLVLLPRCLEKGIRKEVLDRTEKLAAKTVTASGGEEARKAICECRPTLILAIACERDLISGLKDVAEKIPVFALPNRRPQGPCKNTRVALDELDDTLRFIADRKQTKLVRCVP